MSDTSDPILNARIQQYAILRDVIDSTWQDRNFHSKSYSTWLGAFGAGYGFILTASGGTPAPYQTFLAALLCLAGITVSIVWATHNSMYRTSLRSRYVTLKSIEQRLPERPFSVEFLLRQNNNITQDKIDKMLVGELSTETQNSKFSVSQLLEKGPFLATGSFLLLLLSIVFQPWN